MNAKSAFRLTVLCSVIFGASSALATNYGIITNDDLNFTTPAWGETFYQLNIGENSTAAGIDIQDLETPVSHDNFTINVQNATLEVTGDTFIHIKTEEPSSGEGTHALHVIGQNASVTLKGDVDIENRQSPETTAANYGANSVYVQQGAQLIIGNPSSTTRIWSIAETPDAVSAKLGASIVINSTNNQIVGTIDLSSGSTATQFGTAKLQATFSGSNSYWFGDEASSENTNNANRTHRKGELDLTFENGAQWSYLGVASSDDQKSIGKRISSITLQDGGIINLFDEDLHAFWDEIGLLELLADGQYVEDENYAHDYVRIGDLKGSGGIFRLGLNGNDKSKSDLVFIESSTNPGEHFFEPYDLKLLEKITPENTLIFALVGDKADGVSFKDKENLEGETLYDYELEIAHEKTTAETFNREEFNNAKEEFLNEDQQAIFINGETWYIRRVTLSESTASRAMTGAGYAAYDAAIEMDRRDRRLEESLRNTDAGNGLWIRAMHGRSGISGQYQWDRSGVVMGFDRAVGKRSTLGGWVSYTRGDADLLDVNGSGDLTRYELAFYDSIDFENQYIDIVGRIGRVSAEFDATSQAYQTSGNFDQNYAALSAEYGWTLLHERTGLFVEPQAQVQAAYLKSYDYDSQRGMSVHADSATSVLGRLGFRAGRQMADDFAAGQLYVRADVLHQFTDGQDAKFSDNDGHVLKTSWGDKDTWGQVGIGGAVNWGGSYGLQLDVERAFGGDVENTWLVTGRFKYQF